MGVFTNVVYFRAVSYTHLDVYKRQDLDVGAVYGYQYVQGAGEAEAGGF